jgi:2-polyprenyl-3-methyl-5-hydroxy-6-metoxy-1,4-benzoquinol methylase
MTPVDSNPDPWLWEFFRTIRPFTHVLDIGAGDGRFARIFRRCGAITHAVDKQPRTVPPEKFPWVLGRIEWIYGRIEAESTLRVIRQHGPFHVVFMSNILHFLERRWVQTTLMPTIIPLLTIGGTVAIQTISQEPQRPLQDPIASLWSVEDLCESLTGLKILSAKTAVKKDPLDPKGTFHLSRVIARRAIDS